MDKLKKTSMRLQFVVLAMIILTPCFLALNAVTGAWVELLNLPQGITLDASQISGLKHLPVLLLGLLQPVVYMIAFWFLYQLLGLYRQGIIFAVENVAAIRKIGWAIASIDIIAMLQTILTGPVLSFLGISTNYLSVRLEVGYLIIGMFIVLIAFAMDMGRELKEQDSLVI